MPLGTDFKSVPKGGSKDYELIVKWYLSLFFPNLYSMGLAQNRDSSDHFIFLYINQDRHFSSVLQ